MYQSRRDEKKLLQIELVDSQADVVIKSVNQRESEVLIIYATYA
jgi:hypothetical protein